ncbi:hypothetical protein ACFXKG_08530 [Streptomyces sp. NPDC059255]
MDDLPDGHFRHLLLPCTDPRAKGFAASFCQGFADAIVARVGAES